MSWRNHDVIKMSDFKAHISHWSIASKFGVKVAIVLKLCTEVLKNSWRHQMSRDKALKGQFSNSNKSKNKILCGFNFALYLSWEEVYRKIALFDRDIISWILMRSWFFQIVTFNWAYLANGARFCSFFLWFLLGTLLRNTIRDQNVMT